MDEIVLNFNKCNICGNVITLGMRYNEHDEYICKFINNHDLTKNTRHLYGLRDDKSSYMLCTNCYGKIVYFRKLKNLNNREIGLNVYHNSKRYDTESVMVFFNELKNIVKEESCTLLTD